MSLCAISNEFQSVLVLFNTSYVDFRCLEAELQLISEQLDFLGFEMIRIFGPFKLVCIV